MVGRRRTVTALLYADMPHDEELKRQQAASRSRMHVKARRGADTVGATVAGMMIVSRGVVYE